MDRLISIAGLFLMLGIAWLLSTNKRRVAWYPTVIWGVALQLVFAVLILRTGAGRWIFDRLGAAANKLIEWTSSGSAFVFGGLAQSDKIGFVFAFQVLPVIVFVSALSAVLYYYGILQWLLKWMAKGMTKLMKVSGAESLAAAGNVFVGMTEAPLFIRPYISSMTNSELFCLMTGGMATIAGSVMVAYIGMLTGVFPDIAGHILSASVMSAPAALAIAKIMIPETNKPKTSGTVKVQVPRPDVNVIDAAARGATEGLKLALNVGAMLIVFVAMISMLNYFFGLVGTSMEDIFGLMMSPFAFMLGVPWEDAVKVGQLLGEKTIFNEFIAYMHLGEMIKGSEGALQERSVIISTYALCGFANFGSLAIILGGIGGMAPDRRGDLARLGIKSIIGGTLAAFMTAAIAGILI